MSAVEQQTNKPETGRPRKEVELQLIVLLATAGASIEEMAAVISAQSKKLGGEKIDVRTIKRRLQEPEYREAWENGQAEMRGKLRSQMLRQSQMMNSAGVQMSIHLSKHYLGMHDRVLNLNATVDDIDRAIAELERRAGVVASGEQPAGDAGINREAPAPAGADASATRH